MTHRHKRLEASINRRDAALGEVQKLQGRLSAAEERVSEVKADCASRGVSPEKLDSAITQLETRFDTAVASFEKDILAAEGKLAPYKKEDSP